MIKLMIDGTVRLGKHPHSKEYSDSTPPAKKKLYNSRSITDLPQDMVVKILSGLNDLVEISACRLVCRNWRELIDQLYLQARSFCSRFHSWEYLAGSYTVDRYDSSIKAWFQGFGSEGEKAVKQLDELKSNTRFSEILFFFIA